MLTVFSKLVGFCFSLYLEWLLCYIICPKLSLLWRRCFVEFFCWFELLMKLRADIPKNEACQNFNTKTLQLRCSKYGPHHHKQNRDQILDQTTHSMQPIYTNRRVDWINQWNNARGRERLDTVVIIINLVKQTRGWRKIQVKANTQNSRTRGKQKNTGKQQELHIRFPLTCVS